jgi:hypothetical protein
MVLKNVLEKKIKDKDFLIILDEIIDSTDSVRNTSSKLTGKEGVGVPIGNYLSQYFANLYLSELDHFILKVKKKKLNLKHNIL